MRFGISCLLLFTSIINTLGMMESEEESINSDDHIESSDEHIGASVTRVNKHPYAASLLKDDAYVCSAVVLNANWLLTPTKCFDAKTIASYVSHKNLGNYTVRTGSSYNNKGGSISKIKMLINNFDFKVSAIKVIVPLIFSSQTGPVNLPTSDTVFSLGYLANLIAWTPTGHIRIVNAPIIDPSICEPDKLLPGQYVCVGGVQDPNRHFCRRDSGGAVIQNNTLIAITLFSHTCALYTKIHAFPKAASFARWIDTTIWDEGNRRTTISPSTTFVTMPTTSTESENNIYLNPQNLMLTLPFDPVNVPIQPAEDNLVIPRMSMYESYIQNLSKLKTSSTTDGNTEVPLDELNKIMLDNELMLIPQKLLPEKYDQYEYTK